jgi:carbon storage regulator CsrA
MLVLSRREGEAIILQHENGDEIVVKLCVVGSHVAKVGIDAPQAYKILRSELWKASNEKMEVPHSRPPTWWSQK